MAVNEVASVRNALRILDELAERQPAGVGELSRALGLPKSSVQRSLRTLHSAGWIEPANTEVVRWVLSGHVLHLGQRARGELSLREVAMPIMEALRANTRETVHLAVPQDDQVIAIERLDSPQAVRTFVALGAGAPITASANGKAILSTWPPEAVRELLDVGLSSYTAHTVTDEQSLIKQLAAIRRRGYSTNEGEWRADIAAVAAPITVGSGAALAGISISAPVARMTKKLQAEYGAQLRGAAAQIGAELSRVAYRTGG